MATNCIKCHAHLKDAAKFCNKCGMKVVRITPLMPASAQLMPAPAQQATQSPSSTLPPQHDSTITQDRLAETQDRIAETSVASPSAPPSPVETEDAPDIGEIKQRRVAVWALFCVIALAAIVTVVVVNDPPMASTQPSAASTIQPSPPTLVPPSTALNPPQVTSIPIVGTYVFHNPTNRVSYKMIFYADGRVYKSDDHNIDRPYQTWYQRNPNLRPWEQPNGNIHNMFFISISRKPFTADRPPKPADDIPYTISDDDRTITDYNDASMTYTRQ